MTSRHHFAACSLAVTIFLNGVSCTSMKTIDPVTDPTAPVFGRVKAGDTVIVETSDGRRARFVVKEIDGGCVARLGGGSRRWESHDLLTG